MTKDSQQTSANQTSSCKEASHVKMPYNNFEGFLEKFKKLPQQKTAVLRLPQLTMLNNMSTKLARLKGEQIFYVPHGLK